jgi:very-short-patch-repair endonuclease
MNPPRNGEGDRAKRGGGGAGSLRRPTVYTARKLRRQMTLPEAMLWKELRKRPGGLMFRRQHPIDPYVVDFFCGTAALAVEVDGAVHDGEEAVAYDQRRTGELERRGVQIHRVAAAEVMRDIDTVLASIIARAASPLHHAAHGPPPRPGEDF